MEVTSLTNVTINFITFVQVFVKRNARTVGRAGIQTLVLAQLDSVEHFAKSVSVVLFEARFSKVDWRHFSKNEFFVFFKLFTTNVLPEK